MRWTIAVLVLLTSSRAEADLVGPPPPSCPSGSTPSAIHTGPICTPASACTSAATCGDGETCEEVRVCVVQIACGFRDAGLDATGLDAGEVMPCTREHVTGACDASGACAEGTCEVFDACIGPEAPAASGCIAGPARPTVAAVSPMILGALWLVARRARRRP